MVLTLYKFDASPPARSIFMVLSTLDVPEINFVDVNLILSEHLAEDFVKINPQHTIPTLVDDEFVLWDSHAIALYLIEKYGDISNHPLYPSDLKTRATINQRCHFDTGVLFVALRRAVRPLLFYGATSFTQKMFDDIRFGYSLMEKFLTSPWLAGDQFTLADVCCVTSISSLNAILPIDPDAYPRLTSWLERCSELEIYKKGNEAGLKLFASAINSKLA
ncbi:glutathione S-transferase 1-like [Epargyreus clarus]|uniref:glutathione S-transferase 1-like n=1 Tax=Epargyreus clarus TaxID=520877 RepID=UPI003C30D499